MRTVVGMICLGASFFIAGCVSNVAPSNTEAHFVITARTHEGVSVALTSDGCTASVLFDKAAVSGGAPPQLGWGSDIPLKVVHKHPVSINVSGTASGYYSGTGKAFAEFAGGMMERRIFDYASAQEGNWTSNIEFPGALRPESSFSLYLRLQGDEESFDDDDHRVITKMPPADALLTVDSVDLVIAECGKPAI